MPTPYIRPIDADLVLLGCEISLSFGFGHPPSESSMHGLVETYLMVGIFAVICVSDGGYL